MADDEVRWVSSVKFFPPRDSSTQDAPSEMVFFFFSSKTYKLILTDYFSPHFHAPLRSRSSSSSSSSSRSSWSISWLSTKNGTHERWILPFFFRPGSCSKRLTVIERYALLVRFVLVKLCREMIVVVRDRRLDDRLIRRRTILIY